MEFLLGLNLCVMLFTIFTFIQIKKLNKEYEKMVEENKENWSEYVKTVNRYMYGEKYVKNEN